MKLRELILNQFNPPRAVQLIEFGKSISHIDADILMFMARRSLGIYDVLLGIGIPPAEQCIVSNRTLDMKLDPFKDKRVTLIDDTLILGTTIGEAKRQLLGEAEAEEVKVHVFCVDKDRWCPKLVEAREGSSEPEPVRVFLKLEHDPLMTFCKQEVNALSLFPHPYIVDFPFTQPVRVERVDSECLFVTDGWISVPISTELQARNDVGVFTFFPQNKVFSEMEKGLGKAIVSAIDIAKVRVFTRKQRKSYQIQLVPMVTIKPFRNADVGLLFQRLLERISENSNRDLGRLKEFAITPRAQQRLVQYFLSAALGERFMQSVANHIDSPFAPTYDMRETDRHYGPWLHNEMAEVSRRAFSAFWPSNTKTHKPLQLDISPITDMTTMPQSVQARVSDALSDFIPLRLQERQTYRKAEMRDLFATFSQIFFNLYKKSEPFAQVEAHKLGENYPTALLEEAPHKNRLKIGVPWFSVFEYICESYGFPETRNIKNLLSLVLDRYNDLGVAIPITCMPEDGDVVFRAYRHGELALFPQSDPSLARATVDGFLSVIPPREGGEKWITSLVLEKLLALLIEFGLATGLLSLTTELEENAAKISFYSLGAVPTLSKPPKDIRVTDMESKGEWLSDFLLERELLKKKGNRYFVGDKPLDYAEKVLYGKAQLIGMTIGKLLRSRKHNPNGPLNQNSLILLTTCCYPRYTLGALKKELDIFVNWFLHKNHGRKVGAVDWNDSDSIDEALDVLLGRRRKVNKDSKEPESKSRWGTYMWGDGHRAVHSAKMKFVGYKKDKVRTIVEDCTKFLREELHDDVSVILWEEYWSNMDKFVDLVEEKKEFDTKIEKAASWCWEMAACLSAIEIALRARYFILSGSQDSEATRDAWEKLRIYNKAMIGVGLLQPQIVEELMDCLQEIENLEIGRFDFRKAFDKAIEYIKNTWPELREFSDNMNFSLGRYEELAGTHDFEHLLYYDMFDSTTKKKAQQGKYIDLYQKAIDKFKEKINIRIRKVLNRVKERFLEQSGEFSYEMFCFNGDEYSGNDSKHIFVHGEYAFEDLKEVFLKVFRLASDTPEVRVRIYILPCSFVPYHAYHQEGRHEVQGVKFLESLEFFKEKAKKYDDCCGKDLSLLLVAKELVGKFNIPEEVEWIDPKEGIVQIETAHGYRDTEVLYGPIRMKSVSASNSRLRQQRLGL